jgi:hypothetical protein
VVAHFVNAELELEKRLLALKLIDESHTDAAIVERISMVIEYGSTDMIFAITLDNAFLLTLQSWICCLIFFLVTY